MTWDEYYENLYDWAQSTKIKRLYSLTDFGTSSEITEVVEELGDEQAASWLINKAVAAKVRFSTADIVGMVDFIDEDALCSLLWDCEERFTKEQFDELGWYCNDDDLLMEIAQRSGIFTDIEEDAEEDYEVDETEPAPVKLGFFGTLLGLDLFSRLTKRKKPAGLCDGDCANCPPHYGHRYGRWYYGHGHSHGCERGGNRGGGAADLT